jgi:hypothetical protein
MPLARGLRSYVLGSTPKPDESLVGFVFRLSARIGMPNATTLFAQSGFKYPTNRPTGGCLDNLAALVDLDRGILEAISYGPPDNSNAVFMGVSIPFPLLAGSLLKRKACPKCLTQSLYHRSLWDLVCISACPDHRLRLLTSCQACRRDLTWRGSTLSHCRCGEGDLRQMTAETVPAAGLLATAAVYGLLGGERHAADATAVGDLIPFRDLAPAEIVEFLYRMGLDIVSPRGKLFSLEWVGEHGSVSHEALTQGLEVARDWPRAFHRAIDKRRDTWGPTAVAARLTCIAAVQRWLTELPDGHGLLIGQSLDDYRESSLPIPEGYPFRAG